MIDIQAYGDPQAFAKLKERVSRDIAQVLIKHKLTVAQAEAVLEEAVNWIKVFSPVALSPEDEQQ